MSAEWSALDRVTLCGPVYEPGPGVAVGEAGSTVSLTSVRDWGPGAVPALETKDAVTVRSPSGAFSRTAFGTVTDHVRFGMAPLGATPGRLVPPTETFTAVMSVFARPETTMSWCTDEALTNLTCGGVPPSEVAALGAVHGADGPLTTPSPTSKIVSSLPASGFAPSQRIRVSEAAARALSSVERFL